MPQIVTAPHEAANRKVHRRYRPALRQRMYAARPRTRSRGGTYDCDDQGISVGCADVYTPDLDCQWIDISDVPPGLYELVVTVNTERSIHELSFDNNSATVTIEIAAETIRIVP